MNDIKLAAEAAKEVIETAKQTANTLLEETRQVSKDTNDEFVFMLKKYFDDNDRLLRGHFEDDKKSFDKIQQSFTDIQTHLARRDEIQKITAEHFSAMGLELSKMNITLTELKPILDDYKADQIMKTAIARHVAPYKATLKGVAWFVGACAAIWAAIKGFFILILK